MTQDEIRGKTKEKVDKVRTLCAELKMKLVVKTRITEDGFIEDHVVFIDLERYPEEPEAAKGPAGGSPVVTRGPGGEGVSLGAIPDTTGPLNDDAPENVEA